MIKFKENQDKIYIGKHKVIKSEYYHGFLEYHQVNNQDNNSGYEKKYVIIKVFENIYDFDDVKNEKIKYFENGGYEYIKKDF